MSNGRIPEVDSRAQLNTYIYDYFLKNNYTRIARMMVEMEMKMNTDPKRQISRNMNGMDPMDNESKDDLPAPLIPNNSPDNSSSENSAFLLEWWQQFWDVYSAARSKGPKQTTAHQYLAATRVSMSCFPPFASH